MDWRSIRFDWNRARAFLVTATEGSLSAGARALGTTQPTLGRQVAALEEELGVVLFERRGRGLELTPSGLSLLQHVRSMAEAANQLSLAATGQATSLEGNVCISATEAAATHILPELIARLRELEPGIHLEIIATNETSDLKRREADIALRAFKPTQSDLIARHIADARAMLYAAPHYLAALGHPTKAEDFSHAHFIGFDRSERFVEALNERGFRLSQRNFPVVTENHIVHWEMVKRGVGVGVMPSTIGDRDPDVVAVVPDMDPLPVPLWLVAHQELRTNARVRRVYDFLADALVKLHREAPRG
ncbi:MAG: LysR family transcriptional regulator [Pseudomonadota bacterium]